MILCKLSHKHQIFSKTHPVQLSAKNSALSVNEWHKLFDYINNKITSYELLGFRNILYQILFPLLTLF